MKDQWVIEVLEDLRRFAEENSLPALAAKVDETLLIARAELGAAGSHASGQGDPANPSRKAN